MSYVVKLISRTGYSHPSELIGNLPCSFFAHLTLLCDILTLTLNLTSPHLPSPCLPHTPTPCTSPSFPISISIFPLSSYFSFIILLYLSLIHTFISSIPDLISPRVTFSHYRFFLYNPSLQPALLYLSLPPGVKS